MSNSKLQAAHDLRKLSVQLKGILAIGEDLERMGSLEQAEAEMRDRIATLTAQEAALAVAVEAILARRAQEMEAADEIRRSADREREALMGRTKDEADALLQQATREAAVIIGDAKTQVSALRASIKASQAELAETASTVASRKDELKVIQDEIRAVKARLG